MSASISCSEVLAALRRGERLAPEVIRYLGEQESADFFRIIVESLSDSFDPAQVAAYEDLMRAWIQPSPRVTPQIPRELYTIYVLSRVTLGADIKITSIVLNAMKERFGGIDFVFVGNRKSAELFASDDSIEHLEVDYPRMGPVSRRIEFAHELRGKLEGPNRIVIDPDSRMTQLGLIPVCEPEHYFHFPSRTADSADNLTALTQRWLKNTFGEAGRSYIAPPRLMLDGEPSNAAISFGVGENESKRIPGDFESQAIRALGQRFNTLWIDRGAGGDEARRVTAAAEASGCLDRIRFWEGSFAGFTSIVSQCDFYLGYDSAGQHAAAALGVPLVTIFRGAPNERFRRRWAPAGPGRIDIIDADALTPAAVLDAI